MTTWKKRMAKLNADLRSGSITAEAYRLAYNEMIGTAKTKMNPERSKSFTKKLYEALQKESRRQ